MTAHKQASRQAAIALAIVNAIDTVQHKTLTPYAAFSRLDSFVSDGLCDFGLDDRPTGADMAIARAMWPLATTPHTERMES